MSIPFEKFIREDGKIGIVITNTFGAGWWTWKQECLGLLFDKDIVQAVLDGDAEKASQIAEEKYSAYSRAAKHLEVEWVSPGEKFYIKEYDGAETLVRENEFLQA